MRITILLLTVIVAFVYVAPMHTVTLAECCIDPKITQTCAGYRPDGHHVPQQLWVNDNGKIKRGPECPVPQ